MRQRHLAILAIPALILCGTAAAHEVQVGRYLTVAPVPTQEQTRPLAVIVDVTFPAQSVRTVGDALHHLLPPSGFQLAQPRHADPQLPVLLSRPLPEVHRRLGPMPLDQALTTLAGEPWQLSVDPVHRLVSFELREAFRDRYVPGAQPPVTMHDGWSPSPDRPQEPPAPSESVWVTPSPVISREYGPVQPDETLHRIASHLWPGDPVAIRKGLVALLDANPHAFLRVQGQPNMNLLRTGVRLQVPNEAAVNALNLAQAETLIQSQQRDWQAMLQAQTR
ncbi:FimV/HubP family polar landmark protein [uncultured Halomonas sp.]|uniref:PFGI-1 class ICE element type IV pilus protein PilL2 n=1 Tax=uncultured Halomonas sp. TaxID=173971 RepID=UPI002612574D|nr:FimV/HubP family polar landmark protein [uncultured Halomonas sp.]